MNCLHARRPLCYSLICPANGIVPLDMMALADEVKDVGLENTRTHLKITGEDRMSVYSALSARGRDSLYKFKESYSRRFGLLPRGVRGGRMRATGCFIKSKSSTLSSNAAGVSAIIVWVPTAACADSREPTMGCLSIG